ncbi:hypothetical protein EMA8858_01777 [Emticicia aquatica]|uniref:Ig-like domain-containing protein n=1 Tax=Emticicia aquatica TaxID=1681835 RepID=A0ABM9AQ84_9BACT|nr:M36 family metallopeptidase [Emticicia aquatica]CAH0995652.1 hypothetical protein EMA8858_01777 [Emticicia aquatica]
MKKTFTYFLKTFKSRTAGVLLLFLCAVSAFAQKEIDIAKRYLTENSTKHKLSTADIAEMNISSAYLSPTTGWYHIYFNQTSQAIDVYNGILNLTLKDDNIIYVGNTFITDIASKVPSGALSMNLSPLQALQKAAANVNLPVGESVEISAEKLSNGMVIKKVFQDVTLSNEKIDVKLYWMPYDYFEGEKRKSKVALTWNVRFETKNHQNTWNIHVDALTGEILQKRDDVIHCNFGTPNHIAAPHICSDVHETLRANNAVVANSYNVFDYPLESPSHGSRTISTNPYSRFVPASTFPGVTNGWHNDGAVDYTTTRGNNVWSQEDVNNNNGTGASPTSATLDFDYAYTFGLATAAGNQNAAITNLFYWNNLIHDVLWKYGFDEPSGNFQNNNQGRGGVGNDYVFADAQDGGGVNNANFSTPADGGNGRMQMYLWNTSGVYQPDGDFDNGVIAHEYGHGWSIRLTGGPANSGCLGNAEQGGEGWSDYLALMLTTNWSSLTPSVASANISRGIGTYALGQPITGVGIRPFPYSYDMANVNSQVTYSKVATYAVPHGIGSIWATILWDMTWEIILQDNQIVNNIYATPALVTDMKGNLAALKLVNEGLRLQPCSPSFIQSRDAIFAADQALFGGRYRCAIGRAFARRGVGLNASTGVSTNDQTVIEDFTPFSGGLSSALSNIVCSNEAFNYTATTSAGGVHTFSWTRAAVAGISNAAGSGNTAIVNETLNNTTNMPITVTYLFTVLPDDCGGTPVPIPVKLTVNPAPIPTVANYSVCQNAAVPVGEGLVVPTAIAYISAQNGSITNALPAYTRSSTSSTVYTAATGDGSSVFYQTIAFVSPVAEAVTFSTTAAVLSAGLAGDTYLSLYQTSFNPASPATNFLRGDDDGGAGYLSSLTHTLSAGTTYILVVSTYTNNVTGTFTLESSVPVFQSIGTNSWYLNASGGAALATGEVFNPVGVVGSGISNTATLGTSNFYVATSTYPTCRTATSFIVKTTVGGTIAGSTTVCAGTNSGTLTLSGHSGSIVRWESSTDNFVNSTPIANTTTTLPFTNLATTTKYRAVVKNGACAAVNSAIATVTIGLAASPTSISPNPTICYNATTSLAATCTGATVKWYDVAGTSLKFTGSPFVTPSLTTNTTYKVRCEGGACNSAFVSVIVTVNPNLVASTGVSVSSTAICSGTPVTLKATCAAGVVTWYNQLTGGTALGTGTGFTQSPIANTTYYAACVSGVCASSRVATGTVLISPATHTATTDISSGTSTLYATQTITATNKVSSPASVTYKAGKSVSLNAGFTANNGSVFTAIIGGCN